MIAARTSRLLARAAPLLLLAGCGGGGGGDGGGGGGPDPLDIVDTTLSDGFVGGTYGHAIVSTGGSGTYTYSMSGSLPDGLALDADGLITGTPTGPAGTSELTVTVTDSGSPAQTDSQAFTLRIAEPLAADFGTPPLAVIGAPYGHAIGASGGTPPYAFQANLPTGLSIDGEGNISGTPAGDARTATGGATITDSAEPSQIASDPFRVRVDLAVTTAALPDAIGGAAYSAQLRTEGGLPNFSWRRTGGTAPLSVNSSGRVSGTPAAACAPLDYTLDVSVSDADDPAQSASRQGIAVTVVPRAVSIGATSAPPVASLGRPYGFRVDIRPGVAPYAFAITAGALPPGIALNPATGDLSGTPAGAGSFTFTVRVTDDCGESDSQAFTIIVRDLPTGRNDSIAAATPLGNGVVVASISPSGNPNTLFAPDEDYYRVDVNAASTITVDLSALVPGTIDTVVELVNAAGSRLQTCGAPLFNAQCMNDDRAAGNLDSLLQVQVAAGTTFYVHVVDWRGDARPDLRYRIDISGIQ